MFMNLETNVQETSTYDYNLADKLIENIKNHSFDSNNFLNLTVGLPHQMS